jgi:AGCS family alanine or glycine:cation symporter
MMFMTLVIFLFAFSSILGNYAYADGNLTYLGASVLVVQAFRVIVLLAVAGGCLGELPTVWGLADVAMGLMALVNLVAILLLGQWAFGALADYEQALPKGTPLFDSKANPHLPAAIKTGEWSRG